MYAESKSHSLGEISLHFLCGVMMGINGVMMAVSSNEFFKNTILMLSVIEMCSTDSFGMTLENLQKSVTAVFFVAAVKPVCMMATEDHDEAHHWCDGITEGQVFLDKHLHVENMDPYRYRHEQYQIS